MCALEPTLDTFLIMAKKVNYWQDLPLDALTPEQWESLCDGCGLCCLHKLIDADTDEVHYTRVACKLMDAETGLCRDYDHRSQRVPDCVQLTVAKVSSYDWLPTSCAYRLRYQGLPLPEWHPLNYGNRELVKQHGIQAIPVIIATPGIKSEDYVI